MRNYNEGIDKAIELIRARKELLIKTAGVEQSQYACGVIDVVLGDLIAERDK